MFLLIYIGTFVLLVHLEYSLSLCYTGFVGHTVLKNLFKLEMDDVIFFVFVFAELLIPPSNGSKQNIASCELM